MVVHAAPTTMSTVVVAIDVGKNEFAVSVTDAARTKLLKPRLGCPMTGSSVRDVVGTVQRLLPPDALVKIGIEAAGHYHRPLLTAGSWPAGWELLELNPGHVTEQRRVLGKRTIKTDAVDLEAMTELLLAGRGLPVRDRDTVLTELTAWSAHRTGRVLIRTANWSASRCAARPARRGSRFEPSSTDWGGPMPTRPTAGRRTSRGEELPSTPTSQQR